MDEIKENEYNISVSSYLKTNMGEAEIDIEEVNFQLKFVKKLLQKILLCKVQLVLVKPKLQDVLQNL